MRVIIPIALILLTLFVAVPADARQGDPQPAGIQMPDGNFVPMDGLSDSDAQNLIRIMKAVAATQEQNMASKAQSAAAAVAEAAINDPDKLQKYLGVISTAIKEFCADMGVAVNEFITTPVGMIVTAGVVWHAGGKDLIATYIPAAWDIIVCTPIAFMVVIIGFFLYMKFIRQRLIYEEEFDKDTGKLIRRHSPTRVPTYDFESKDAKTTFVAVWLIASAIILFTCFCLAVSI